MIILNKDYREKFDELGPIYAANSKETSAVSTMKPKGYGHPHNKFKKLPKISRVERKRRKEIGL